MKNNKIKLTKLTKLSLAMILGFSVIPSVGLSKKSDILVSNYSNINYVADEEHIVFSLEDNTDYDLIGDTLNYKVSFLESSSGDENYSLPFEEGDDSYIDGTIQVLQNRVTYTNVASSYENVYNNKQNRWSSAIFVAAKVAIYSAFEEDPDKFYITVDEVQIPLITDSGNRFTTAGAEGPFALANDTIREYYYKDNIDFEQSNWYEQFTNLSSWYYSFDDYVITFEFDSVNYDMSIGDVYDTFGHIISGIIESRVEEGNTESEIVIALVESELVDPIISVLIFFFEYSFLYSANLLYEASRLEIDSNNFLMYDSLNPTSYLTANISYEFENEEILIDENGTPYADFEIDLDPDDLGLITTDNVIGVSANITTLLVYENELDQDPLSLRREISFFSSGGTGGIEDFENGIWLYLTPVYALILAFGTIVFIKKSNKHKAIKSKN